jgi:hypothetical protein
MMKNKRERDIATATNPYYRGGILPLHHGDEGRVVGGDEVHTGSAPPEFSPPIFDLPGFCFVFLCFGDAPFRDP